MKRRASMCMLVVLLAAVLAACGAPGEDTTASPPAGTEASPAPAVDGIEATPELDGIEATPELDETPEGG